MGALFDYVYLYLVVVPVLAIDGQEAPYRSVPPIGLGPAPEWSVPARKRIRLLIDSDAANQADDQLSIAHALLSPKFVVRGLIATHFKPHSASTVTSAVKSMEASYEEIQTPLRLMKIEDCVPVNRGAAKSFTDPAAYVGSEGGDFIIQEAFAHDPRPLLAALLAPLTDLAAAYLKNPKVAERLTAA